MRSHNEQDRAIERLLRHPRASTAPRSPCVDGETLAAWSEGTLSASRASLVEAHLSVCADCQSMLAGFVRAVPAGPAKVGFFERWQVRWLLPLATAAAAMGIWVAVPEPGPSLEKGVPAQGDSRQVEPRQAELDRAVSVGSNEMPPPHSSAPPPLPTPRASGQPNVTVAEERKLGTPVNQATASLSNREQSPEREEQAPAEIAASPAPQILNQAPETDATAAVSKQQEPVDRARTDSNALVSPEPRRGRPRSSVAESLRTPREWTSPDGLIRWRVTPDNRVERTTKTGTAWDRVAIDQMVSVTAGTAPGASVCWLVGREGLVLRSTDGRRFDRVPFQQAVDLVAVRATSATAATVTAADGRLFATTDGGQTWRPER